MMKLFAALFCFALGFMVGLITWAQWSAKWSVCP